MRIALIGANGQLGTVLQASLDGEVRPFQRPALDVCDAASVREQIAACKPDVVINCAAATHVDGCEDDPAATFAVNACGAGAVAQAADAAGAKVVTISTDYVFGLDAARTAPYAEDDAPGPVNTYGASKLAGEHMTRAYARRSLIVRTSGLYGYRGARGKSGNFVETMLRLADGGRPIRVVDDQRLSPTNAAHLAKTINALIRADATGVVHTAAADSCTWHAFASAIFEIAGKSVDLQPITSAAFGARAVRPHNCALQSRVLGSLGVPPLPGWRAMLQAYLEGRPEPFRLEANAAHHEDR